MSQVSYPELTSQERFILHLCAALPVAANMMSYVYADNCCTTTAVRILHEVLKREGVAHEVICTEAIVMNVAMAQCMYDYGDVTDANEHHYQSAGAHCLHVGSDEPVDDNSYLGHLVVQVPYQGKFVIMDLSGYQFNRPKKSIEFGSLYHLSGSQICDAGVTLQLQDGQINYVLKDPPKHWTETAGWKSSCSEFITDALYAFAKGLDGKISVKVMTDG